MGQYHQENYVQKSILFNKDYPTWLPISWRMCISANGKTGLKSLLTNIDFVMAFLVRKVHQELYISNHSQTGQPASAAAWERSEENWVCDSIVALWWNNVIGIIEVATTGNVQSYNGGGSRFVLLRFFLRVLCCALVAWMKLHKETYSYNEKFRETGWSNYHCNSNV